MDCYLSLMKGHQSDVNCLSSFSNLLASGSEDSTIRIWDITSQKSIRRLTDPSFSPSQAIENVSILETSVFASTSSSIYEFDIRNPSKILLTSSLSQLQLPFELSSLSQSHDHLLVSTDDGEILLLDKTSKETKFKSAPHTNVSLMQLCSSAFFLDSFIVSGGFDCRIMLLDLSGATVSGISLEDIFPSQGFNPPHVYDLDCKGNQVAFALGSGNVCVFEYRDRLVGTKSVKAHEQRVVCVALAKFDDLGISADCAELSFWRDDVVKKVLLENKVLAI